MAAAERTRGARDMVCSHLPKARTRITLPFQPSRPLKVPAVRLRRGLRLPLLSLHQIDRLFPYHAGIADALGVSVK
jgi:hypothetical protein